jgi:ABC-type phosphate transport system substrate-binding protein
MCPLPMANAGGTGSVQIIDRHFLRKCYCLQELFPLLVNLWEISLMNIRTSACCAATLAAVLAGTAYAASIPQPTTIIYGGGATLPAIGYIGTDWLGASPALRRSNTLPPQAGTSINPNAADKKSLFNQYALTTAGSVTAGTPPVTVNYKQGEVGVSYCQTGSGTGRRVMTGQITNTGAKGETANGNCYDYSLTPLGFSSPNSEADFAGSDVALSQKEIGFFATYSASNTFVPGPPVSGNANLTNRTQIVQIPTLAGAVAIVYNNSTTETTKQLNVTQSDICGIFSGTITNFSQLTHTPKVTPAAQAITVIYRNDGSGTSFSFTNYLSKVCGSLNAIGDTAVTGFQTTDTFQGTTNSGGTAPAATGGSQAAFVTWATSSSGPLPVLPGNFVGANGNGAVVAAVASTPGAIGYAEVADAVARAKVSGGGSLKYATVSFAADQAKSSYNFTCPAAPTTAETACAGKANKVVKITVPAVTYAKLDPIKSFPSTVSTMTSLAVVVAGDEVLNGIDGHGRPIVQALADTTPSLFTRTDTVANPLLPTPGPATPYVPGCLGIVEPDTYAQPTPTRTNSTLGDGTPVTIYAYGRYPIVAVTNLEGYNGGNGTKKAAVQGLLEAAYTSGALSTGTKTIGAKTGFAALAPTFTVGTAAGGVMPAGGATAGAAPASMTAMVAACVVN